jgi:hypothetical protein
MTRYEEKELDGRTCAAAGSEQYLIELLAAKFYGRRKGESNGAVIS